VDVSREKARVVIQCGRQQRDDQEPPLIDQLRHRPDVERLRWRT
jgi:hypothetical protein